MQAIAFTLDTDWSPPEIVQYALDILDEFSVKGTLFLTDDIAGHIETGDHELAIHPNFSSLESLETAIARLLEAVPGAIGIRSHTLFYTARLLPLYAKYGIQYDSNVVMYNVSPIYPYKLAPSVWELPVFFMDNIHLWMHPDSEIPFDLDALRLGAEGVKVFTFHPIHIFLNTETQARYEAAKPYYGNPEKLREYENPESSGTGTRVILRRLLALASERGEATKTLAEVVDQIENGGLEE